MNGNLEALETWATGLLEQLGLAARNKLARSIGQELRRSQQKRVQTQQNPDGSKFAPRKMRALRGKQGRIRRKVEMFKKLRTATYMKVHGDSTTASVGFTGRIARIARVHQYGLKDRAERGAPEVNYEQRKVLGFTEEEMDEIRGKIINYLTAK
ncbi:phage virion morphogenesis protein [Pseudomonas cerasi]